MPMSSFTAVLSETSKQCDLYSVLLPPAGEKRAMVVCGVEEDTEDTGDTLTSEV